ncbi:hypothetical protein ACQP2K_30705 [Microbispora siamensis]
MSVPARAEGALSPDQHRELCRHITSAVGALEPILECRLPAAAETVLFTAARGILAVLATVEHRPGDATVVDLAAYRARRGGAA